MSDDNARASFHSAVQRLLYDLLTVLVKRTGCLIEYQNLRILDQRPSDGYSLLLPAGQFGSLESTNLAIIRV